MPAGQGGAGWALLPAPPGAAQALGLCPGLSALAGLFSLAVSFAKGAGLCHGTSGLSPRCRGLSPSTGASTLGLPLAAQWQTVLSLSFCPFILPFVEIWALCTILKDREGGWL